MCMKCPFGFNGHNFSINCLFSRRNRTTRLPLARGISFMRSDPLDPVLSQAYLEEAQRAAAAGEDQQFEWAWELVLNGHRSYGYELVCAILRADKNNVDALYLYAVLAPNRDRARIALRQLLSIDPQHA